MTEQCYIVGLIAIYINRLLHKRKIISDSAFEKKIQYQFRFKYYLIYEAACFKKN